MQITKNRTATTVVTLFLMLTIAASIVAVLPVKAEIGTDTVPSFLYISVAPDPVGVGQSVGIVFWTKHIPPPTWEDPSLGAPGGRECWLGVTLTITKPDGTKQTIAIGPSDPVGSNYYIFVPDTVGTYSVQAHFPGQWKNATSKVPWGAQDYFPMPHNWYFESADSIVVNFTVQQEQLQWLPGVPLPTEYWTRPIFAYNREWSTIAGNWISGNPDLSYITAPDTAHVMWTEPYFFGGVAGGEPGTLSYYEGTSYESKFSGVTIMQGVLFYNLNLGSSSSGSYQTVVARDLRTGELLWQRNQTSISWSEIYEYYSRNQHGVHPYLWAGNSVLDPFSGTGLFRYTNVPSGADAVGATGERLIYVLGGPVSNRTWLALWNSSAPLSMTGITAAELANYYATGNLLGTDYDQWRPVGKVINGNDAYQWNVTLPPGLSNQLGYGTGADTVYALSDRIISGSGLGSAYRSFAQTAPYKVWAVSTKKGSQGQLLWQVEVKAPVTNGSLCISEVSEEEGVVVMRCPETRQWIGLDIDTGKQLWITEPESQWAMYNAGCDIMYGKLYSTGYGGEIYAYDIKTGKFLWKAAADLEGLESVYDRSPLSMTIIDGKIYARSTEHSFSQPYYRTWKTYCFNATTGERIWDLAGTGTGYAFADGYMVYMTYDDLQIYCIGKGPTATTVEAPMTAITVGTSTVIQGTVTDISAGTKSSALTARFPNGVPAMSDESMTDWMQYVYMQMPKPTNVTGVPITLDAIDPNGNRVNLGTATSDASGFYSLTVNTDALGAGPGTYKVIATFAGSNSYWSSYAESTFVVAPAPPVAQPVEYPQPIDNTMTIVVAAIAIIIAVALAAVWIRRK
jgi:hypothetical protein